MPVGSDRQRITCLSERTALACALRTRRMCFCRAYRKLRREVESRSQVIHSVELRDGHIGTFGGKPGQRFLDALEDLGATIPDVG